MDNPQEAKEILEEMRAEGHDVPADLPGGNEPPPAPAADPEPEGDAPDAPSGEEGKDRPERQPERERPVPTWSMLKKAEKERDDALDQLRDIQKGLEDKGTAASQKAADQVAEAIDEYEQLSKEIGGDPKAIKRLTDFIRSQTKPDGLSPEDKKLLDETRKARLDQEEKDKHQVEMQRASNFFPELKESAEAQKRLEELGYSEKYAKTPLVEVYLENKEKILGTKGEKGTRSGEASRGGSQRTHPVKDIDQAAREGRFEELSDEEFDAWSDQRAAGRKYRKFTPAKKDNLKVTR